jgi:hypothetical protein
MTDAVYSRAVQLMEADVGNELVALDPDAGNCFGFNEVATSVWRSLEQPKTFEQLRKELLSEYEVDSEQCSRELDSLLEDMVAKRLLEKK